MKAVFQKTGKHGITAMRVQGFRGYPPMFHPHLELIYVIKGEIPMTIDGQDRVLRAGEMSVLFPLVVHSYESAPEAEACILLFEPRLAGELETELLSKKPIDPFLTDAEGFLPLLSRIIALHKEGSLGDRTARAYLAATVGELLLRMPLCEVATTEEDITRQILVYCSEHFADEDICLRKIAEALYISPSYVSKVFAYKLKYGLREYINALRVSRAKELLRGTRMRIVEIMLECGFKNQSSFNRIFTAATQATPRDYRERKRISD
ncbi:MAG: helix-turn-helix transcriptional regulator [Clostridia bacterium]|nr:helix-turn-helix transcriptional regulator [Clostridia bacterium]